MPSGLFSSTEFILFLDRHSEEKVVLFLTWSARSTSRFTDRIIRQMSTFPAPKEFCFSTSTIWGVFFIYCESLNNIDTVIMLLIAFHFWSDNSIVRAILWTSSSSSSSSSSREREREREIFWLQYASPQTRQNAAHHNMIPNHFFFDTAIVTGYCKKLQAHEVSINSFGWVLPGT